MKKKVAIIGAGFSGLTSAFYLNRAGYDVEIYESSSRAGGLIGTKETPDGLVETAANALLNSVLVEELFEILKVPIVGAKKIARHRYIERNGRLRRWPFKFTGALRFAGFLLRRFLNPTSVQPKEGESIRDWGHRVLGPDSEFSLEAALQGVYAGDPKRLSAKLVLSSVLESSKVPKPRLRGSVAPPNGMAQLITALETFLRSNGAVFHFDSKVDLTSLGDARPIVVTTNPSAAANLLRLEDQGRAMLLDAIELSPVVTTTAFFSKTDPKSEGFGAVFPPAENPKALGVLKNNFVFEDRANACFSETWIMGGAIAAENPTLQTDEAILETIQSERARVFHLDEKPKSAFITRWPKGIPHYTLELEKMLPRLNEPRENVFLMGNYLGDLGLAKILRRASNLPVLIAANGKWK